MAADEVASGSRSLVTRLVLMLLLLLPGAGLWPEWRQARALSCRDADSLQCHSLAEASTGKIGHPFLIRPRTSSTIRMFDIIKFYIYILLNFSYCFC